MVLKNMTLVELYDLKDNIDIELQERQRETAKIEAWKNLIQQIKAFIQNYGDIAIHDEELDEPILIDSLCDFDCCRKIFIG